MNTIKTEINEKLLVVEDICKGLYSLSHNHGNKEDIKKYIRQIRVITDEIYIMEWKDTP